MREGKLPLRTVLENFINHVDTLEAKRSEGNDQYEVEFQELKQLTESLRGRTEFSCTEGEKDVNRRKNRYKDILPYDYTRVALTVFPGVPGSDYINANFIRGASGSRAYIGSQGPLPHTVPDFWRMVVECEVQVIIMASNETEGGKHKCECYWVNNQNEERQFGNVSVSFVKARQVCPDFLVRTLKIKYSSDGNKTEERTICQFHYVLWPDHGVPETVRPLLDMVRLVRDCQASETLPVLVHCSAGCGRTGTICAIDYVWGLLRAGRLTENLDLFGLVKEMRRQRVAMVQTREQYILLHRAVRELFKERLKVIDAHPYENIATDGTPLILREKESDYEELYMRPEKQDESAKPTPPTTTPSVTSTPTGSLTRYAHSRADFQQPQPGSPPAPACVLSLHMKHTKSQAFPSHSSLSPLSQSFPGPHTLPLPQPSPLSPASSLPAACTLPSPSPSKAQLGVVGPPARGVVQPCLAPQFLHVAGSSKLEKEAENATHKQQISQLPAFPSVEAASRTPAPGVVSPRPPAKSHTSHPVTTTTTTTIVTTTSTTRQCDSGHGPDTRPSIAKLKELFERSCPSEGPAVSRLSRRASSVTARTALSLHSAVDVGHKIKRKSSLGAEETLATKKAYKAIEKYHQPEGGEVGSGSRPAPASQGPRGDGQLGVPEDGSTLALLARVDERPALPVKKSKSFRYVRPGVAASRAVAAPRSPELARKKADINAYFSLDRCRPEGAAAGRGEGGGGGAVTFLGDVPSPREGFKLSVYQMPRLPAASPPGEERPEARPQIPPKRLIGEKSRAIRPPQFLFANSPQPPHPSSTSPSSSTSFSSSTSSSSLLPLSSQLLSSSSSSFQPFTSCCSTSPSAPLPHSTTTSTTTASTTTTTTTSSLYDCPRELQALSRRLAQVTPCLTTVPGSCPSTTTTTTTTTSPVHCPTTNSPDSPALAKDYVNARLVRQPRRVLYVPLPAKRATLEGRSPREYANCSLGDLQPAGEDDRAGAGTAGAAESPLYDDVSPAGAESGTPSPAGPGVAGPRGDPAVPGSGGSGDYEVMDFGESGGCVDEVFETVNYRLVAAGGLAGQRQRQQRAGRDAEGRARQDLDPVAQQVFQVCRDYLQQGDGGTASLEEVASRVAVAPQGLRTRERRNSYRRAVNHLLGGEAAPAAPELLAGPLARRLPGTVHKYETIWFDNVKQLAKGRGQHVTGPGQEHKEPLGPPAEDLWANLDLCSSSSSKEVLFREKLEELHSLVAGLGRPGCSEDEGPSKGSASGSGSLGSSSSSLWYGPEGAPAPELPCSGAAQQPSPAQGTEPGPGTSVKPAGQNQLDASLQNGLAPYGGSWGKPLPPYTGPPSTLPAGAPYCNIPLPEGVGFLQEAVLLPPQYSTALPRGPAAAGKAGMALYTRLPAVVRHRPPHPLPQEGALAGDVAHEGEESIPMRKGREAREGPDIPVAPPRVKRNSFLGPVRYTGLDAVQGSVHQQWRGPGPKDIPHHPSVAPKQVVPKREDEAPPPPAVPAKTAAAFEFLDAWPALPPAPAPAPAPAPPPAPAPSSLHHHSHYTHLPPPKPLPAKHQAVSPPPFPACAVPGSQRQPGDGELCAAGEEAVAGCSSSDSSDEEGIFHKFSAPSIFRRWRSGGGGGGGGGGGRPQAATASPKSTFYEGWDESTEAAPPTLASPTSPKPLAKALGKLRLNSRSVAANFKSYLSQRSGQAESGDPEAGGRSNGFPCESAVPPTSWRPLTKSVSSGGTLSALAQVAQDYKYPNAIPKKPAGPRDMPGVLRGTVPAAAVDGPVRVRMEPPRQQYL